MRWTVGVVTGVLLLRAAAWATCHDTDTCLRAVEARQQSTHSLAARFEQTKYLSLMTEPLVSRGRFAFKQPDQVLWEVDDPHIVVRIDAEGVHLPNLPNAEAELAALTPFSAMLRELSGVFTGSLSHVRDSFDVSASGDDAGIRVHLTPRRSEWQRMFRAVDLQFAAPDLVMKTIRIDEALGDRLEIVFLDVHRNDDVANAAFAARRAEHD